MAIRLRSTLKQWFKRGKYPLEEQFADWIDSFLHKTEDKLPLANVDGLPEQLNAKYDYASGVALEEKHNTLRMEFDQHTAAADEQFERISDDIEDLQAEDERQQEEIDALEAEVENIHKKDDAQDKEITALHKTDSDQQAEIDTATANLEHLRKRLHPTAVFGSLESTFSALGANYSTLWALANTLKNFLEANDTTDSTINRWQEIETFLQGITDTQTLSGLMQVLEKRIINTCKADMDGKTKQFQAELEAVRKKLDEFIGFTYIDSVEIPARGGDVRVGVVTTNKEWEVS